MRTKILLIVGSIILSILILVVLYQLPKTYNKNTNEFFRKFPPHFLYNSKTTAINEIGSYITGMDSSTLYLGHSYTPQKFTKYKWQLNQIHSDSILIRDSLPIAWKALKSHFIGEKFYFMEGLTPHIFESSPKTKTTTRKKIDSITFIDCLPITSSRFVIKTLDSQRNQQVLALLTEDQKSIHTPKKNLQKQVDGFFCTDGDLIFNQNAKRIIYTYRYRNEFLIFDSNLKFLYAENTIDLNFQAQIKVSRIKEHGIEKIRLTSPPYLVNKKSFSQGQWLFIHSNIISKNEDQQHFYSKSVIDIYDLESGAYKYSFYIPSYKENLMKDFAFYNNTLAVLYNQGIIIFNMNIEIN